MTLIPTVRGAMVGVRPALLSILAFWLLYFAVASARSLVMPFGNQWEMAGLRAGVCLIGVLITYVLYRVLRRTATMPLRAALLVAALASAPAAVAYSAANWMMFYVLYDTPRPRVFIGTLPDGSIPAPRFSSPGARSPALPAHTSVTVGSDPPLAVQELRTPGALLEQSMNGYFFMAAWCALYLAMAYASAVREAERRAATFRAAAQAAELRALRYQVSPHFLFNTLNSLSSLVLQQAGDEAERMIQNLSTFFRTSLTADPTADVTLHHEIELQRLYLDIEAVRFRDRLVVEVDVPDTLQDACVPGLILQPLVENAVKYGVSRSRRPVRIVIRAAVRAGDLILSVSDDGDPMPAAQAEEQRGTGVGLANVRDRLAARYGEAADCRYGPLPAGGWAATLTMPLVRG